MSTKHPHKNSPIMQKILGAADQAYMMGEAELQKEESVCRDPLGQFIRQEILDVTSGHDDEDANVLIDESLRAMRTALEDVKSVVEALDLLSEQPTN